MLGVSTATLSRRSDLAYIEAGDRDHRVPAAEVVRLAGHYKRRAVDEVAYDLVAYARRHARAYEQLVGDEVDHAVEGLYRAAGAPSTEAFLRDARRLLPGRLYQQVLAAVGTRPSPRGR